MNSRQLLFIALCVCPMLVVGCSRGAYRSWADRDAYRLINTRQSCQKWAIPARPVEAASISRMSDLSNPDCPDLPADDPAASCYMQYPGQSKRVKYWDRFAEIEKVESEHWRDHLPVNEQGEIALSKEMANQLALYHSRVYQDEFEAVYLQALSLSQNQFEFETNWFGRVSPGYSATPAAGGKANNLSAATDVGFSRNTAIGGQLLVGLANSFSWQLGSGGVETSGGNILLSLSQPFLRNAFRHVRLESLTQGERDLLYRVREFARFRRTFYLEVTRDYFSLLGLTQQLYNERSNLENLSRNLDEHKELERLDMVTPIQTDQVYQDFQSGRQGVFRAEQNLESALDQFKQLLGLPYDVELRLDETILDQFELSDPQVTAISDNLDQLGSEIRKFLDPNVPSPDQMGQLIEGYFAINAQLRSVLPAVNAEHSQWRNRFLRMVDSNTENCDTEKGELESVGASLVAFQSRLDKSTLKLQSLVEKIQAGDVPEAWAELQKMSEQTAPAMLSDLYTSQLKIRLFSIGIEPLHLQSNVAVEAAVSNRLDLKNQRAFVVDAFRRVEVAADQLESDLDVSATANLATDPTRKNPLRFDSSASSYSVGVQFDGPLNRFSERNGYRSAQIQYQQARRQFMATKDQIANGVRQDLRNLEINEFNFESSRLQLLAAVRQVELSQTNLRDATDGDSSLTQDLLRAFQQLLNAQNQLVANWVSYEISRIQVFVDLETLMLDESGNWMNQNESPLVEFDSIPRAE